MQKLVAADIDDIAVFRVDSRIAREVDRIDHPVGINARVTADTAPLQRIVSVRRVLESRVCVFLQTAVRLECGAFTRRVGIRGAAAFRVSVEDAVRHADSG